MNVIPAGADPAQFAWTVLSAGLAALDGQYLPPALNAGTMLLRSAVSKV
jgi:hypothetical protein